MPTVALAPPPGTARYWRVTAPVASSKTASKVTRPELPSAKAALFQTTANFRLPAVPVVEVCTLDFLSRVRSSQNAATVPFGLSADGSATFS